VYINGQLTTINYSKPYDVLLLQAHTESEFREIFEREMKARFDPKLNKMQEWLYGDRIKSLSRETLKDIVDSRRGMGKTTAQALKQIVEAIQNPNKPVKLLHDHGVNTSTVQQRQYRTVVKDLLDKLDFKFMVIREHDNTLTFEV
jgi:hypothetical protein